jgi:hypothetical protein
MADEYVCERCYDLGCIRCVETYPRDWEVLVIQLRDSLMRQDFMREMGLQNES